MWSGSIDPDNPTKWTTITTAFIGKSGFGSLDITGGSNIIDGFAYIGYEAGSTGAVMVDGYGSIWTNDYVLSVGGGSRMFSGSGTLNVTGGGTVRDRSGEIGFYSDATGEVTVDGNGSTWTNSANLSVGNLGSGVLNIINYGLVSVAGALRIDGDEDGDDFIDIATGGMLALYGDADDSLASFLGLIIDGTDAIRLWDYSISDWADITGAILGVDYTLSYLSEGDLAGYTVLTASTPEPTVVGDANHDGVVDAADAAVLATYWQEDGGVFWGMGDFNGDGAIDDIDATLLATNWGKSASDFVPEPSTLAGLLGLCLAGLVAWARS